MKMKKVFLSLLMVMLVLFSTFANTDGLAYYAFTGTADNGFNYGSDPQHSAFSEVFLNATVTLQAEVGLTYHPTTAAEGNTYYTFAEGHFSPVKGTGSQDIPFTIDPQTGYASVTTPIYATWLIQSGEKMDVFLLASGDLSDGNSHTIDWKVSASDNICVDTTGNNETGILKELSNAKGNYNICSHKPSSGTFKNYGSQLLSITTTESVWGKPSGVYTANLYIFLQSAT